MDADNFVSEKQIDFDVARIDQLLGEIVGDSFVPIQNVASFALYPICGTPWNLYVLESYCWRFSEKYRLSVSSLNDRNKGIIASADLPWSYQEMLSRALADAVDVLLTPEKAGAFLFDNGYTLRRSFGSLPEIVSKAKTIREGR